MITLNLPQITPDVNSNAPHTHFIQVEDASRMLCRNPYDRALHQEILHKTKDNRITLAIKTWAILSSMSVGKVNDSLHYLIKVGLVMGEQNKKTAMWTLWTPQTNEQEIVIP